MLVQVNPRLWILAQDIVSTRISLDIKDLYHAAVITKASNVWIIAEGLSLEEANKAMHEFITRYNAAMQLYYSISHHPLIKGVKHG